jgi:transposase InsO family protein
VYALRTTPALGDDVYLRLQPTTCNESLKYEHLYQREIATAAELAEEVAAYLVLYNEIRPHETLGLEQPLAAHLAEQHLFRG